MNDQILEKQVMNKVGWRLLPYLVLAYLLCYIDRTNLGFAALTMNKEIGVNAYYYGWGAGIFFIGYFLFEVPSNVCLKIFGARIWIARIMITWGILSALMSMVWDVYSFVAMRFLLGAAEAGFFPGVVFYLTYWFPDRHRGKVLSRFMFAQTIALMLSAALSGWILSLDGVLGLAGWKWLFITEGVPSVLLGIITYFYLTDRPATASWLTKEEREWLIAELEQEEKQVESVRTYSFWQALTDWKVLLLGLVYVSTCICNYGTSMFLPQIIKTLGDYSPTQLGYISAIPYVCAAIGMLFFGYTSDKYQERKYHLTGIMLVSGLGLLASTHFFGSNNAVLAVTSLSIAAIGFFTMIPIFWILPSKFLTGTAAAAGIALINAIGNLGGFAGPFMIGYVKDTTGSFLPALVILAVYMLIAAVVAFWFSVRTEKVIQSAGRQPSA